MSAARTANLHIVEKESTPPMNPERQKALDAALAERLPLLLDKDLREL